MELVAALSDVLSKTDQEIAHGDFATLAEVFRQLDYGHWTGDYIRKVLRGYRTNTAIVLGACAYYQERAKMQARLKRRLNPEIK